MEETISKIEKYVRATNYLTAIQIYLRKNALLEEPLTSDDIKPRLLGHWGTCPGINFIYAHLNALIKRSGREMLFVLGPGHGFAALQANLFLEGTLSKYYKDAVPTREGISYLARTWSWPYGFPSHSNPGAPGVIVEGGELGYALGSAYGAILDNPDLIATCVVGDGEAETGPTATAWHLNKLIDPARNGAVLPIVHVNEYKISGPTLYGRMSDRELKALFVGYGYEPHLVKLPRIHEKMYKALDASLSTIRDIQTSSRSGVLKGVPRFPVIILRSPKGWTGIKKLDGKKLEGNYLSHQVIAKEAKENARHRHALERWLRSYRFHELWSNDGGFVSDISDVVPAPNLRMGNSRHVQGGEKSVLELPPIEQFSEDATVPGTIGSSSMRRIGEYLREIIRLNKDKRNFRLFSPDETYSNKLDAVFEVTSRSFVWPKKETDENMSTDGRVIEMLSEHSLQALMQGYTLTGRYGVFASYEAFIQIVASMADQYVKFLKIAREINWRPEVPSFNYILTSSGWRQEHNGFSHQNPGFIDAMLQKQGCFIHVYFPPDGTTALACMRKCLQSTNGVNVIIAGKTLEPRWLTPSLAMQELERGLMVWDFASDPDPDIVFAAAGDYLTKESLAAIRILKAEAPNIKVRFVSILELSALGVGNRECRLPSATFEDYFTRDKPVIFNFHGYPQTLKQILFDYEGNSRRFSVNGYIENGSTTTSFDMQILNKTSRYHVALETFEIAGKQGMLSLEQSRSLVAKYQKKIAEHGDYIRANGVDPEEIEKWQWKN